MSNTINSPNNTTTYTGVTDPFLPRTGSASSQSVATKDMFLKLLVTQIKNQDPMNPSDGVQFLTQLAQFTQLEQSISMTSDIHSIRTDLEKTTQPADQSTQTPGTGN